MTLLKKLKIACAGICLASAIGLESKLYSKDIYVPKDYTAIQSAIDASESGDRILVAAGEYVINEPINYKGKNISLNGNDPKNTIIHMSEPLNPGRSSVFIFENGETNESVLEGFTIIGGGSSYGGGISCIGASPIIRNNVILKNGAGAFSPYGGQYGEGGGIYCENSEAQIIDNFITNNGAHRGGGIMCFKSNTIIMDNKIFENFTGSDYGGGIGCQDTECIIKENLILRNTNNDEGCGGGIGIGGGRVIVEDNIIYNNGKSREKWFYPRHGGGICIGEGEIEELILRRNLIIDNRANLAGGGIYFRNWTSPLIINNTLFNNTFNEIARWVDYTDPIIKNCIILNKTESPAFYSLLSQPELCGLNGNICTDPGFSNPNLDQEFIDAMISNGDYEGFEKYIRDSFNLLPDSPCIDAGDPNSPIDPDGTRADIGALFYDQRIQQNPSIRLEEIVTSTCNPAFVRVFLTNYCPVEAFSFGLTYDPLVIKAGACNPSGATALLNEGKGPEFWHYSLNPLSECNDGRAGVTVGMVGSLTNPAGSTIARHINQEIATLIYNTVPGVSEGMESSLDFVECLRPTNGTPPTPCVITCNSSSIKPVKISGRVYISGNCFKRGDCNCDNYFDISDAVSVLNYLYDASSLPKQPCCFDACDANDDGKLDVSDGIRMLGRLFIGSEELPYPYRNCGNDPTLDDLTCKSYDLCNNKVIDGGY